MVGGTISGTGGSLRCNSGAIRFVGDGRSHLSGGEIQEELLE